MTARIVPFDAAADVRSIALRVAPLDVGFDLRVLGVWVHVPDGTMRASYADRTGARYVVEGTTDEIVAELTRHGYRCVCGSR